MTLRLLQPYTILPHHFRERKVCADILRAISFGVSACILMHSATTRAIADPVVLNVDASFEGLADSSQRPLTSGLIRIGWVGVGITDSQIHSFALAGNLSAIDSYFHEVASFTDLNSFGAGLPFQSLSLVDDGNLSLWQAYTNPTTGAAGRQIVAWILNRPGGIAAHPDEMAWVTSDMVFPTAADTVNFTDFTTTFSTDSQSAGIKTVFGAIESVVPGSLVDINGGSPADGLGLFGGSEVLTTESIGSPIVAVPEGNNFWMGVGLSIFAVFRVRPYGSRRPA